MSVRIGVDIDGVLANYHKAITNETIKRHGKMTVKNKFKTECSVLDKVDDVFWLGIEPIYSYFGKDLGSALGIKDVEATVYFITRRPPCLQYLTTLWLNQHFDLSNVQNTVLVTGAVEKSLVVNGLLIKDYYDDDPIHCMQIARLNPAVHKTVCQHPGNLWFDKEEYVDIAGEYLYPNMRVIKEIK